MNKETIIKLISNKNYVEAEIHLQSLILKDPKNSDYNFFFWANFNSKANL